jgi:hypothetical protein
MPVSSPYAVFRAGDLCWPPSSPLWPVSSPGRWASTMGSPPPVSREPSSRRPTSRSLSSRSRAKRRQGERGLLQGELFLSPTSNSPVPDRRH